jgi:hypothetical protein
MNDLNNKMFAAIEAACLAEGGDGDTLVVCQDNVSVADNFEKWLKENNNTWWTRGNYNGIITFYNNQEAIYFALEADKGKIPFAAIQFYDLHGFLS